MKNKNLQKIFVFLLILLVSISFFSYSVLADFDALDLDELGDFACIVPLVNMIKQTSERQDMQISVTPLSNDGEITYCSSNTQNELVYDIKRIGSNNPFILEKTKINVQTTFYEVWPNNYIIAVTRSPYQIKETDNLGIKKELIGDTTIRIWVPLKEPLVTDQLYRVKSIITVREEDYEQTNLDVDNSISLLFSLLTGIGSKTELQLACSAMGIVQSLNTHSFHILLPALYFNNEVNDLVISQRIRNIDLLSIDPPNCICGDNSCPSGEEEYCSLDCSALQPKCNNNVLDESEACDTVSGTVAFIGGITTCVEYDSTKYTSGPLSCSDNCAIDDSACSDAAVDCTGWESVTSGCDYNNGVNFIFPDEMDSCPEFDNQYEDGSGSLSCSTQCLITKGTCSPPGVPPPNTVQTVVLCSSSSCYDSTTKVFDETYVYDSWNLDTALVSGTSYDFTSKEITDLTLSNDAPYVIYICSSMAGIITSCTKHSEGKLVGGTEISAGCLNGQTVCLDGSCALPNKCASGQEPTCSLTSCQDSSYSCLCPACDGKKTSCADDLVCDQVAQSCQEGCPDTMDRCSDKSCSSSCTTYAIGSCHSNIAYVGKRGPCQSGSLCGSDYFCTAGEVTPDCDDDNPCVSGQCIDGSCQELPDDNYCEAGIIGDLEIDINEPDDDDEFYEGQTMRIEVDIKNTHSTQDIKNVNVEAILYEYENGEYDEINDVENDSETEIEDGDELTYYLDLLIDSIDDEDNDFYLYVRAYDDNNEEEQCNYEYMQIDEIKEPETGCSTNPSICPTGTTCTSNSCLPPVIGCSIDPSLCTAGLQTCINDECIDLNLPSTICTIDNSCTTPTGACNTVPVTNVCVNCTTASSHCDSTKQVCNLDTNLCENTEIACTPGTCTRPGYKICDTTTTKCVNCTDTNLHCDTTKGEKCLENFCIIDDTCSTNDDCKERTDGKTLCDSQTYKCVECEENTYLSWGQSTLYNSFASSYTYHKSCSSTNTWSTPTIDSSLNLYPSGSTMPACTPNQKWSCPKQLGVCVGSYQTCLNTTTGIGRWAGCSSSNYENNSAYYSTTELLDGMDNDCDGSIDEGLSYTNQEGATRIGYCSMDFGECSTAGVIQVFKNNVWSECTPSYPYFPRPETGGVNTKDENCDGSYDEGNLCLGFTLGTQRSCGTTLGACSQGKQTCTNETFHYEGNFGIWGRCEGATYPTSEIINCPDGIDNDCDGLVDEDCGCIYNPSNAYANIKECTGIPDEGICVQGSQVCQEDNTWSTCIDAVFPEMTDTCDDGLDNDCDGSVDEDCPCESGDTRPCSKTKGVCEGINQSCGSDGYYPDTSCDYSDYSDDYEKKETSCGDELDNDCDGDIDMDDSNCKNSGNVCSDLDQTEVGMCGSTRPQYCRAAGESLVNRCARCPCPSGKVCQNDGSCKSIDAVDCPNGKITTDCICGVYEREANSGYCCDSKFSRTKCSTQPPPPPITPGEDSDEDGWDDDYEESYGTNPYDSDTDFDGVIDSEDDDPLCNDDGYCDNDISYPETESCSDCASSDGSSLWIWVIIIILVILLLAGGIYYYMSLDNKYKNKKPMMINPSYRKPLNKGPLNTQRRPTEHKNIADLVSYVKKASGKGIPTQKIIDSALKAGWTKPEIDQAFRIAKIHSNIDQLVNYVQRNLRKGYTEKEIKEILSKASWSAQEITHAFIIAKKSIATPKKPVEKPITPIQKQPVVQPKKQPSVKKQSTTKKVTKVNNYYMMPAKKTTKKKAKKAVKKATKKATKKVKKQSFYKEILITPDEVPIVKKESEKVPKIEIIKEEKITKTTTKSKPKAKPKPKSKPKPKAKPKAQITTTQKTVTKTTTTTPEKTPPKTPQKTPSTTPEKTTPEKTTPEKKPVKKAKKAVKKKVVKTTTIEEHLS